MSKIDKIRWAIEKADMLKSDLPISQLDVPALTSLRIRHLLNNLGRLAKNYLEVGVHKGGTFTATISGNNNLQDVTAIDSFESDHMQGELAMVQFEENSGKHLPQGTFLTLIVSDSFDKKHIKLKHGHYDMYLYDGDHSEESQKKALTFYKDFLRDEVIFLCDDYDWLEVQKGTQEGIKEAGFDILFEKHLQSEGSHNNDSYWNGFYVSLLKKKS